MPDLRKTALALGGAVVGAALAYPPARRQVTRAAAGALDTVLLRADTPWTQDLVLVTSEGHLTRYPRTTVLAGVQAGGALHVVPFHAGVTWLKNVRANPEVVVDDRHRVWRARAEVIEGDVAAEVRRTFLERHVPGPLRSLVQRGADPSSPVVRLVPR